MAVEHVVARIRRGFARDGFVVLVEIVVAVLLLAELRVVVNGGEVEVVKTLFDGFQRREDFVARLKVFAFLRPAGDAIVGAHEVVAVVVGQENMNAAVFGEIADGVAAVGLGGKRQGGRGGRVLADIRKRYAICLGRDAVGEIVGCGISAAHSEREEQGEGVTGHDFS